LIEGDFETMESDSPMWTAFEVNELY
jgi:hypothetical protein